MSHRQVCGRFVLLVMCCLVAGVALWNYETAPTTCGLAGGPGDLVLQLLPG